MAEIKKKKEGYVYTSYGQQKYLRHVLASVSTLRRYDQNRPVTVYCSDEHVQVLKKSGLSDLFDQVEVLPSKNRSITGFKHNVTNSCHMKKTCIWIVILCGVKIRMYCGIGSEPIGSQFQETT